LIRIVGTGHFIADAVLQNARRSIRAGERADGTLLPCITGLICRPNILGSVGQIQGTGEVVVHPNRVAALPSVVVGLPGDRGVGAPHLGATIGDLHRGVEQRIRIDP